MQCHLCLQEKDLKNSHIIPEFFYKPLYDGLHRFTVLSTSQEKKTKYRQKGMREKLLCYDCEQFLSSIEDYVKRVFFGGVKIRISNEKNFIIIEDIDYKKFKLFQLSILWRSGISKLNFFSGVSLGPHEEKLREMLFKKNPGEPYEYGCLLAMILMDKDQVLDGLMMQPDFIKVEGYRCFRFLLGGCVWLFFVSKHNMNFKFKEYFLNKDGKLIITKQIAKDNKLITGFAQDLKKAGKLNINYNQ